MFHTADTLIFGSHFSKHWYVYCIFKFPHYYCSFSTCSLAIAFFSFFKQPLHGLWISKINKILEEKKKKHISLRIFVFFLFEEKYLQNIFDTFSVCSSKKKKVAEGISEKLQCIFLHFYVRKKKKIKKRNKICCNSKTMIRKLNDRLIAFAIFFFLLFYLFVY